MADTVKNIAKGPRGLHATGILKFLDAGEERDLNLSDVERAGALSTGYFEISGGEAPDREQAIRVAIGALDADDEDHWTADGRPDVYAINDMMPADAERVTAAERDAVWAEMQG